MGLGVGCFIPEIFAQNPQIEFVINQVRQRMFKGSRQQLAVQSNGQQLQAGVYAFEAGHRAIPPEKLDARILQVAHDRRNIRKDFFYNFVMHHER